MAGAQASMTFGRIPVTSLNQPSWKSRTRTPKAAPAESRFRMIALSGMMMEWKATSRSRKLMPSTKMMTSGIWPPYQLE